MPDRTEKTQIGAPYGPGIEPRSETPALRDHAQARDRAEQLYAFAQRAVRAQRLEDVFEASLDAVQRALGTDRAAILVFDDMGVMRFRAWRGLSDEYRRAVEGHSPWIRESGGSSPTALLVPDVRRDLSWFTYLPIFNAERITALAFIPLLSGGRLLGKFVVYFDEPREFAAQEVELATALGSHLAAVIDRFAVVAKLEEKIRYEELFAGVLAHDLRNPITAIVNAATLLLRRRQEDDSTGALQRIVGSGERIARMITQLLDFAQARSGLGLKLHRQEVDLAQLCDQAIAELELGHPEWIIRREYEEDTRATCDPDRIIRLMSNLLDNAGRHARVDGRILVRLDGARAEELRLTVHNEGAIDPAVYPDLFDPFRAVRHGRGQSGGLGLGLYIVNEIVRAHGGRLGVESDEDTGTTVTVILPRERASRSTS